MDQPTDKFPFPSVRTTTRPSADMSTAPERTPPSTPDEPASPRSRETHSASAPSSSDAAPLTLSQSKPTLTSSEPSNPVLSPSRTSPPSSESSRPTSSAEPSATPTLLSTSVDLPTTSETPSVTTSIESSITSFITSTAVSSSAPASTTSAAPTIAPVSPSGLPNSAKLGLAIGLPAVFGLALLMGLIHCGRKRYQNNKENKQRVKDIEEQAQLAAFQSQMAQPAPAEPNGRGSAMFGIHASRFGDVQQVPVAHPQRYQPYSQESNYRGW